MRSSCFPISSAAARPLRPLTQFVAGLFLLGCSGDIGSGRGADVADGAGDQGGRGDETDPRHVGEDDGVVGGDPGVVPIHRLNRSEYDNTIRDLLGVETDVARTSFSADEVSYGFDSIASALGINDARYEMYFEAGAKLVDKAFADASLRARIVSCAPASDDGDACTRTIIERFGLRAWRRPLSVEELDQLLAVAAQARQLGADHVGAIRQVVWVMLASPQFLYRAEPAVPPSAGAFVPLDPYALASRLSYLLWSTMPDDELLAAAADGSLENVDGLQRQFERMATAPRAREFLSSFGGQWLGMRKLASHQVEPTAFPTFDEPLRQAMLDETLEYLAMFFEGGRPLSEFFTADVNFVNARLAKHYGLPASPGGDDTISIVETGDARVGFLGLASFLTLTSFSYRTSPTLRGIWVLENLLCEHIPPPPDSVEELDDDNAGAEAGQSQNVRQRLEEHRRRPDCAACHDILDPIGIGLETFDGIGRYRDRYPNGDPVDASGRLMDGSRFNGARELAALLADDTRFGDCAVDRAATYALSRGLTDADVSYKDKLRLVWQRGDGTLLDLLSQIVASGPFRYRRGEALEASEVRP